MCHCHFLHRFDDFAEAVPTDGLPDDLEPGKVDQVRE
jgi:hypothetical protein